jgi:hypothetical protein
LILQIADCAALPWALDFTNDEARRYCLAGQCEKELSTMMDAA